MRSEHLELHGVSGCFLIFDNEVYACGHIAVGNTDKRRAVNLTFLTLDCILGHNAISGLKLVSQLVLDDDGALCENETVFVRNAQIIKSCLCVEHCRYHSGLAERFCIYLNSAGTICPSLETILVDFRNINLVPYLLEVHNSFLYKALILNIGNIESVSKASFLGEGIHCCLVLYLSGIAETVSAACNIVVKGGVHESENLNSVHAFPLKIITASHIGAGRQLVTLVELGAKLLKKIDRHKFLPPYFPRSRCVYSVNQPIVRQTTHPLSLNCLSLDFQWNFLYFSYIVFLVPTVYGAKRFQRLSAFVCNYCMPV